MSCLHDMFDRSCLTSQSTDRVEFGESWLFYGCRHKEQDFLYRLCNDCTAVNIRLIRTHSKYAYN